MVQKATASAVDIYVQQTILLTRSIVFKSSVSAERLNKHIVDKYGEDSVLLDHPETWKYYMNIAGQYHFTDRMMQVISLDTQQLIDFTVNNMRIHTATAEAYRYGTRYYYTLVRRFPEQEQLVMSVINPADIAKAIQAEDGDVLSYYKDLVEYQEDTLIYDIEGYIKNYLQRYTVAGFQNVWNSYPVLNYAVLYQSLPAQIMNLRLEAIKSARTHSFHITQYLGSHGYLDRFIPFMTLKQKLYLYHNIDFLEKYAGFTDTFEELIQWILNDRYIPLSSYTVRQLQEHNGELYPILRARRNPLGTLSNSAEAEYLPIEALYDKEKITQPGNPSYDKYHQNNITHALATDDTSVIQTKDLESAMVDYTDSVPNTLPDVLLRQWAYMSSSGLYNVLTNFTHPFTGERVSIMASDALIYYSYVFLTGIGQEPLNVPDFVDVKFRLHPRPPVEALYQDLVKDRYPELKKIAQDLVSAQPIITECLSTSAFFDLTYKIFQECEKHWVLTSNIGDPMMRGIVAKMISRLFGISCLELAPPATNMKAWLIEKSLPQFNGTYYESLELCNTIFQAATGYTVDETKSLRAIQKAMIEMFRQLSSYSIQIMREINDSAVIPLNWSAIRIGVDGQEVSDDVFIIAPIRVISVDQEFNQLVNLDIPKDYISTTSDVMTQNVSIKATAKIRLCEGAHNSIQSHGIEVPVVRISEALQSKSKLYQPFLPNEYYEQLTEEQKLVIARQSTNEAI